MKSYKYGRIMVIDDEEFCLSATKALLVSHGIDTYHHVDFCIDGQEALDTFIKSYEHGIRYKMILTDFKMPLMDGIEVTKRINQYLSTIEDM